MVLLWFSLSRIYVTAFGTGDQQRSAIGNEMRKIEENYQRIKDDRRLFDIRFWQSQGDLAIFEAVAEMLNDYFLIRGKNVDESRLQRTIENFRKA